MRFRTAAVETVPNPLSLRPDHVWMSAATSLWGWGTAHRIDPERGIGRVSRAEEALARALEGAEVVDEVGGPGTGPVAFASFTFSPDSPGSVVVVPEVVLGRRDGRWWLTTVDDATLPPAIPDGEGEPPSDRARYAGSSVPDVLWLEAVAEAVRRIEAGDLEKVVLARDYAVWSRAPFLPERLLAYLARTFPRCHVFRVDDLLGASPELLLRRRGDRIESLVLAGSAPVYDDPGTDAAAERDLLASDKDLWEHELAVRSVQEALAPVADLQLDDRPTLLRLDNVRHLATTVAGQVAGAASTLALVERMHPTAAVGGTPTPAALGVIEELEGMDRGRYAGPVGWVDARGDGDFAIALRCAELYGARARLFAGAGIVTGSLPESELEETRLKLQAMMGALGSPT